MSSVRAASAFKVHVLILSSLVMPPTPTDPREGNGWQIHETWDSAWRKTSTAQVMHTYKVAVHGTHPISLTSTFYSWLGEGPEVREVAGFVEISEQFRRLFSRTVLGGCHVSDLEPRWAQEWRIRPSLCQEVFMLWCWWWLGWGSSGNYYNI